jgi:HrpA-like RNA helicase
VTTNGAAEFAAKCLDVPFYVTNEIGEELINPNVKRGENRYDTGLRIVGYKHGASKGMDNVNTKLLFCTDGTLKQKILSGTDTTLSKYGGVVIDEAHERSVNIDIVIALLMDIIKVRPDFKVIIMSATIDLSLFKDYCKKLGFGHAYGVYELPDIPPLFERRAIKDSKKMDTAKLVDVIYNRINEIILNPDYPMGDILAFVTSDAETAKVKKRIDNNMRNYPVDNKPFAIAFSAQVSENDKNIAKNKGSLKTLPQSPDAPQGYSRKVIIGTNAVESSVTFGDDLVYVIETGLAYEKIYNADKYAYVTGKNYVSQASIDQRCGRTGRTCNGWCFQLYTESQFKEFEEYTAPKIRVEDITKELLSIISLPMNGNLQKGLEFISRMIEPPKNYQASIYRAYNNLLNMDLIDSAGNFTMLGRICNSFNKFDLKIAKMVIGSFYLQCHYL